MRMSVRLYNHLVLFALIISSISVQALSEYKRYGENLWELEVAGSDFESGANYTRSGGSYDALPNGNTFKLINIDLGVRWCPTRSLGIYAESRLGIAESKDPIQTRSNSQFNRALLGTDFVLLDGPFKIIPDLQVQFPLVKADPTSNIVQTSEGDTEFLGRVISRFDFWKLRNQASLGIDYRDGGRATLMTYGAGSEYEFSKWFVGAELVGSMTIVQDENAAVPSVRESAPLVVNARSAIFNTVNPSLLATNLWLKYDTRWNTFQIGYGATITGANTAQGQSVFANWTYRFQSENSHPIEKQKPEIQRFQEETKDDVDQTLFQAPPPPAPQPPPKKIKSDSRKQLQKDLDQTEMQIELKAKKKKPVDE